MTIPRFILAADHRSQFEDYARQRGVELQRIRAFKRLIVEAFDKARSRDARASADGGLLLDRTFGNELIAEAGKAGIRVGEPLEAAGVYPLAWADGGVESIAKRHPPFAKVLISIPAKDPDEYRKHDSAMIDAAMRALGDVPLLVELVGEGKRAFNQVAEGIFWIDHWLSTSGPRHWKVAGDDDPHQLQRLIDAAPAESKFLLLGGGVPVEVLRTWFAAASELPAFVGFAVGRTVFWPAFEQWTAGGLGDGAAVDQIADRYLEVLALWK